MEAFSIFFHCASGTVASPHCMGISVMEMLLKCEYIINSQEYAQLITSNRWSGVEYLQIYLGLPGFYGISLRGHRCNRDAFGCENIFQLTKNMLYR